MNKFKIITVALLLSTLSGCALTELAKDYLNDAVDTNQHEKAREIDKAICEPDVLSRLQKTRSAKWYNETVADCQSRKEKSIPLAN